MVVSGNIASLPFALQNADIESTVPIAQLELPALQTYRVLSLFQLCGSLLAVGLLALFVIANIPVIKATLTNK